MRTVRFAEVFAVLLLGVLAIEFASAVEVTSFRRRRTASTAPTKWMAAPGSTTSPGHYAAWSKARDVGTKARYYCLLNADSRVAGQYREDVQDNNGAVSYGGSTEANGGGDGGKVHDDFLRDGVPRYLHCQDNFITIHRKAGGPLSDKEWRVTYGNTRFYQKTWGADLPPAGQQNKLYYNSYSSVSRKFKRPHLVEGQCNGCTGCKCGSEADKNSKKIEDELESEAPSYAPSTMPTNKDGCRPSTRTKNGNAENADCAFPFEYKGKTHSACITIDNTKPWCYTTRRGKWGECTTTEQVNSDGEPCGRVSIREVTMHHNPTPTKEPSSPLNAVVFPSPPPRTATVQWTKAPSLGAPRVEETCKDNNKCLQAKPGWGSSYTCAGSTAYCDSYKQDMHECCPKSCNACPATAAPTIEPTVRPSIVPTEQPTSQPTATPTEVPTTVDPTTDDPLVAPTITPTEKPTTAPTATPTDKPTAVPTMEPTAVVTVTNVVSTRTTAPMSAIHLAPPPEINLQCIPVPEFGVACGQWIANQMDSVPSECTNACYNALLATSRKPGCSKADGAAAVFHVWTQQCKHSMPTPVPTEAPTEVPSHSPTESPTEVPTSLPPTASPTAEPTATPTEEPTAVPTVAPTEVPTTLPPTTDEPSYAPTHTPTEAPTAEPTATPTEEPTMEPTMDPSDEPTLSPTQTPTEKPSFDPSLPPTELPTIEPSVEPTDEPSTTPTDMPTAGPTMTPCPKGLNGLQCSGNGRKAYETEFLELGCKKVEDSKLGLGQCSAEMANFNDGAKVSGCAPGCIDALANWMVSCKLSSMHSSLQNIIRGLSKECGGGDGSCKCACNKGWMGPSCSTKITAAPSHAPTELPSAEPTATPTHAPTYTPTELPTAEPTATPTQVPTTLPPTTDEPSFAPSHTPTEQPTAEPTQTPTEQPTAFPTREPTTDPTVEPTEEPTAFPTREPTADPTVAPTSAPTTCGQFIQSDLILAIDSSGSIDDNQWSTLMTFTDKLIADFPIAEGGMGIANVQFGNTAKKVGGGKFMTNKTKAEVIRQRIKHGATGTMTRMDRAADAAMEMFADYGRRAVPNVLLVLSDGLPTGGYLPGTQADKAFKKARANGAQVLFVLVGTLFRWIKLPSAWMDAEPIQIDNFAALDSARRDIVKMVCKATGGNGGGTVATTTATTTTNLPPALVPPLPPQAAPVAPIGSGSGSGSGGSASKPPRITKHTPSFGGNDGGAVNSYCPDGHYINWWRIRTGSLVDRIQGRCSNGVWLSKCGGSGGGESQGSGVNGAQKMYVRTGAVVDQFNGRGGNGGAGHWLDCGSGFKVTGYLSRCGSLVDKVQFQCKNV